MSDVYTTEVLGRIEAAKTLTARLPDLKVQAQRIAANVMLGVHGLRKAGPGENFWQFRPYVPGEPAKQIDWRRSALSESTLFVREREWSTSQSVWLWADLSTSMNFRSHLASVSKIDRAVVLLLGLAELLGRGGERVGIPGIAPARLGRNGADRLAKVIAQAGVTDDWPDFTKVGKYSSVVIISDFLMDMETLRERLKSLTVRGVEVTMLQVFDPVEESFPYDGRAEFRDPETGDLWLTEHASGLRGEYRARIAAYRAMIREVARPAGFSFAVHHTDRPASEALLMLTSRLSGAILSDFHSGQMGLPKQERPAA